MLLTFHRNVQAMLLAFKKFVRKAANMSKICTTNAADRLQTSATNAA